MVVGAVAVEFVESLTWPTTPTPNRRHIIEQRASSSVTSLRLPPVDDTDSGINQTHLHRTQPDATLLAFEELEKKWKKKHAAMVRLWRNTWEEFIPFLDYNIEIRRMICSTNAIESLNARYRRAIPARGHFPTEQAAMKCLYLVIRSLDPTGTSRPRWTMRWKPVLDAFAITFGDR